MTRGLVLVLLAALLPVEVRGERTFGLVVGIDDYTYITDLHGAVNDARDIADALTSIGAEVTLLTDAAATREAIMGRWEDIIAAASPGDRLIVSYAGHGSNEPEHTPGSERDGRDENFLLAGFAPRGEAAAQRIRDDEIADLLARSAALDVIFVADACHAGTVTRDLRPALGYRYVAPEDLTSDPLPPPPPPLPAAAGASAQAALFLAAVNETEKVPEFLIDGTPRGALSYAFARGLRGAADLDGDRVLTKGEIETYVRRTVRQVSDGAQLPQSEPAGLENKSLIALGPETPRPAPPAPPKPLTELAFEALPPLAVGPGADWSGISGVEARAPGVLRREGLAVYSSVGDRLAVAAGRPGLQAVVDKHRLISALNRMDGSRITIGFDQGDRVYHPGQTLTIRVEDRGTRFLTLFNLAADGTVSLLYPVASLGDPAAIAASEPVELAVGVTAPFGADHVVAVETDAPAPAFRDGLARLRDGRDMALLWDLLRRSGGRVSLFPFFTSGGAL